MKRLFQSVATVIVSLVCVQPALAGLLCAPPGAVCPAAMTDMAPGCSMASQMADGCPLTAYLHAVPQSLASVAFTAKPKWAASAPPQTVGEALLAAQPIRFARLGAPPQGSSPPLYILHRVFRI